MKKLLSVLLALCVFTAFSFPDSAVSETAPAFRNMNDPALLQFVEDQVYAELSDSLDSENYIIENVQARYISQEYLDELEFNSQANLFFGYTLAELKEEYRDSAYVFTLGEHDETIVEPFEDYDDTYDRVIRNVAIGAGVILVCVTVSVATGGLGLTTVSLVFAASAKTAATTALASGALGGIAAGVIKGYQTGDVNEALKAAAYQGSESFKWGAISGAITGGLGELRKIHAAANAVSDAVEYAPGSVNIPNDLPQWRQAELRALNEYGGYEQLTYLDGQRVLTNATGGTRPDIVRVLGDHIEAIEVKYYDLEQSGCLNTMFNELEREVSSRIFNLPAGSTQRIVLDVTGRGYSSSLVNNVASRIWDLLDNIYPNIPIDIIGL